jgi:hypothetical protein
MKWKGSLARGVFVLVARPIARPLVALFIVVLGASDYVIRRVRGLCICDGQVPMFHDGLYWRCRRCGGVV